MAYSITIPFHAVKLRFATGQEIWYPLADKEALRLNEDLQNLADHYAAAFQEYALNAGRFMSILEERKSGRYMQKRFSLEFSAAADKISHPGFSLEFDYFQRLLETGKYWGLVPSVGCEAVADTEEALEKSLEELVRLDFSANNRLSALQLVVSLIWYDAAEMLDTPVKVAFPSPAELEREHSSQRESWLQKAAYMPRVLKPSSYGREEELKKLIRILKSPYMKNTLLLGPGGVGKTALVQELIRQKSKAGLGQEIWETTASTLIKELTTDTGWQENLSQLCRELKLRNGILFVRNLFELFEVGKYEGNSVSMAEYLAAYLGRGEITILSECTPEEKSLIELRSPGFMAHFQTLQLEEPTARLEEIILKKAADIAQDQKTTLSDEAVKELIRLNKRYTPYAGFPGKPIRFLESLLLHKKPTEKRSKTLLDRSEIIRHFCRETGIPPFMADPAIPVDFEEVRKQFAAQVFGQDRAVDSLVNVLSAVKMGLNRRGKPIASFLFAGPTGVGKTELVKVLAEFMFGNRDRLTRFDMSEFSSAFAVRNLIGVEGGGGGLLTNAVRREPFGVVLFDEIEKAHPSFFDYLLQVLGEGRLTDQSGKVANFCSSIIILTSNIGASNFQTHRVSLTKENNSSPASAHFITAVQKFFRPELFNRIDQVIPFEPLSAGAMSLVIGRELTLLNKREGIAGRKMNLDISPEAINWLSIKGFDPQYGARYLQRTLQTELVIPLANILNQWDHMDHVVTKVEKGPEGLVFNTDTDPLSMELLIEELQKLNLSNLCADRRNAMRQFSEGSFYLELVNNLAILEREKNLSPGTFWKDGEKSKRYDLFHKTKAEFSRIRQNVESLEDEISLACMGYSSFAPSFSQKLATWNDDWLQFRTELFLQLFPGDTCWLSVYGKKTDQILKLYRDIVKKKNFSLSGGEIWLNPAPVNPKNANPKTHIPTSSGKEHFQFIEKRSEDALPDASRSPFPEGTLYGVHWRIEGPGAWWLLGEEGGIQKWVHPNFTADVCKVSISKVQPNTPNNIHRKEFYDRESVRRTMKQGMLTDTQYKVKDEYWGSSLSDFLLDRLERNFQQKIEEALQ